MDTTLLSPEYSGGDLSNPVLEKALALKSAAMAHGGDFTMLWHNSNLTSEHQRRFFQTLLQ